MGRHRIDRSFPVVHSLIEASLAFTQTRAIQMTQNFHILAKITEEPSALPPIKHASAHILKAPLFERKFAEDYTDYSQPLAFAVRTKLMLAVGRDEDNIERERLEGDLVKMI